MYPCRGIYVEVRGHVFGVNSVPPLWIWSTKLRLSDSCIKYFTLWIMTALNYWNLISYFYFFSYCATYTLCHSCSVARRRPHDKCNLEKTVTNWGFPYSFWSLAQNMAANRQADIMLEHYLKCSIWLADWKQRKTVPCVGFWDFKAHAAVTHILQQGRTS